LKKSGPDQTEFVLATIPQGWCGLTGPTPGLLTTCFRADDTLDTTSQGGWSRVQRLLKAYADALRARRADARGKRPNGACGQDCYKRPHLIPFNNDPR